MVLTEKAFIRPDWPAPKNVKALQSTRLGGVSHSPYDSLNLGAHVLDDEQHVLENRRRLEAFLPSPPLWLQQVHGTQVVTEVLAKDYPQADASITNQVNSVCAVMTADCLPVLLCDQSGCQVAAVHAGWRGLAAGILEKSLAQFRCAPESIMAWLGPAIGPDVFEVGMPVVEAFCDNDPLASAYFTKQPHKVSLSDTSPIDKWHADLYGLARLRLKQSGVKQIYGGNFCTLGDEDRFFSYRRDGTTGRMASCIWLVE